MKILFVNEYSSLRPVSGAEYSQSALAKALKAEMFTPNWKTNQSGQGLSPLWFNNPLYYLYSAWEIFIAIKRHRINIIHVHGKYILPGAVIAGWLTGKPVVITVRDFKFLCPLALCFTHQQKQCRFNYYVNHEIPDYQQRYDGGSSFSLILGKLWQYQLKWWLNRCRRIICVSPQLAEIYRENKVKNVDWIYNLPPKKQAMSKGNTVLSVGKLSYGKGTDSVVEAAKLLPQYQFVFAGSLNPSFKADFPKNCQYIGKISHEQVLKLYQKAAVFVINSRWPEPLSRAGLEALSFGLPIVASDRGGNRELVKDNGYLVNPEKVKEIAGVIDRAAMQTNKLGKNSLKLL
ncbi:MAG: glycosyltransferase family 4 protein, partial [bacterium]|nr:glycosyltransferase family 4 protein [bacterium]